VSFVVEGAITHYTVSVGFDLIRSDLLVRLINALAMLEELAVIIVVSKLLACVRSANC